jgi:hypothetical protein
VRDICEKHGAELALRPIKKSFARVCGSFC